MSGGEAPGRRLGDRNEERDERRGEERRAQRIEAVVLGDNLGLRHDEPSQCGAQEGEGDGHPEDRAPAGGGDQRAAEHRTQAQAHRLRRRHHADCLAPPLGPSGDDQDDEAVCPEHRPACPQQDAEDDEARQVGCKPAEGGGEAEEGKSGEIERLASADLGEPREHRQRCGESKHIADRDPAHRMQGRRESVLERGHRELDDAGVDLANESADAHRADHEPWIGGKPREKRRRRWLGEFKAQVQRTAPELGRRERKKSLWEPPRWRNGRFGAAVVLLAGMRNALGRRRHRGEKSELTVYRDPWRPVLALPARSA